VTASSSKKIKNFVNKKAKIAGFTSVDPFDTYSNSDADMILKN
jgi:hypothetical protein